MCLYCYKTYNFVMVIYDALVLSKHPKCVDYACFALTNLLLPLSHRVLSQPTVLPSACVLKLCPFCSCLLSKSLQGLWLWSLILNSLHVC